MRALTRETRLLPSEFLVHQQRNYQYLMELKTENLLRPYLFEAGLYRCNQKLTDIHWGWDGPLSDLRGQFTGHWLSAAAQLIAATGDAALKLKAEDIVAQIGRCQQENGGEWGFSIPEKRLLWLKNGKQTWAPQYVCHKTMMGLLDMARFAGCDQALDIVKREADWFYRFSADISRETMDHMMDVEETGGLMELWADLYDITRDERHLELMRRYERPLLFEPLLRGEDVLTNMHANTTIPEIHGAARAYEVTGEERYRRIVESYWRLAVEERGMYATGGQTCGELWTPPGRQAARLGEFNQEHCAVYNMMRLADYLLRWSGDARYADYYERNLWNGVLSQGYWEDDYNQDIFCNRGARATGLVAYYQGLQPGAHKYWGSRTEHFWCCHGTLVQANAALGKGIFYQDADGPVVCQFIPAECQATIGDVPVRLTLTLDPRTDQNIRIRPIQRQCPTRPESLCVRLAVHCDTPTRFTLRIRKPWWLLGEPTLTVNGEPHSLTAENGYFLLEGQWHDDEVVLTLGKGITCHRLPDEPDTVAFLDGPMVLAALCKDARTLYGDPQAPERLLAPRYERCWQSWQPYWRTVGQPVNLELRPLYQIGDQEYTVYFPIERPNQRPDQ